MDKKEFEVLVDQKLLTDVSFVSDHLLDEDKLNELKVEDLADMGMATSLSASVYVHPDFEQGGEFILDNDVVLFKPIVVTKDTIIDLNGHDITNEYPFIDESDNTTNSYIFWVKEGKLTIKGQGAIKTGDCMYSMAIWAHGGEYYNAGEGSDLIYASAGGSVEIYGGEFHPGKKLQGVDGTMDEYTALNIKDRDKDISKIVVYGGKFYNFDPANNQSEGPGTNFVAEGYESVETYTNIWEVKHA